MLMCKVKTRSISSVFDVMAVFVMVVGTHCNVHILYAYMSLNYRCILIFFFASQIGQKAIQQQYLQIGVLISCYSSHSLHLKLCGRLSFFQIVKYQAQNYSLKSRYYQYLYDLWGRNVLM